MGTNYYWHDNPCPHCKRPAHVVHIGKSSVGWTFTFHGTELIRSFADWRREFSNPGQIVDEYDRPVPVAELVELVERKRNETHNHAQQYPEGSWLDPEGHSFTGHEFS